MFVSQLDTHTEDFRGFLRDIAKVRYCAAPFDPHQSDRMTYAVTNMGIMLSTLDNAIATATVGRDMADKLEQMMSVRAQWQELRDQAGDHLSAIQRAVSDADEVLAPLRARSKRA